MELLPFKIGAAEVISIVAALISLLSAIVAVVHGGRMYRLAQEQERRKKPSLSCYFHRTASSSGNGGGILAFLTTLGNSSELPNFLTEAKLQASYSVGGVPVVVQLNSSDYRVEERAEEALIFPINFAPYESKKGWVEFSVSPEAMKTVRSATRFKVIMYDTSRNELSFETNLPKAFDDFPTKNKS